MASKIHLFKKSAIEAGTPDNYYLNPSENLFKIASKWRVVEHEGVIDLNIHMRDLGDDLKHQVYINIKQKFIDIIVGEEEFYKKRPPGYADGKNGLKNFSIEMNPNFLKLGVDGEDIKAWEGIARMHISKLTPEEIKNNQGPKINAPRLTPGENEKVIWTVDINLEK